MNAYLFSRVNGVIVSEPVLTSTQWKDWAAALLPPPSSLRSLIPQLNHALRDPEVAGLGRDLDYFLEGGQAHILTSLLHLPGRALLHDKSIHLIYPVSILLAQSGTHWLSKAPGPRCFDAVQLFRVLSQFCTGPCRSQDSNEEMPCLHSLQDGIYPFPKELGAWLLPTVAQPCIDKPTHSVRGKRVPHPSLLSPAAREERQPCRHWAVSARPLPGALPSCSMALSWKRAYIAPTAAYTTDTNTVVLWGLDPHDSSVQPPAINIHYPLIT